MSPHLREMRSEAEFVAYRCRLCGTLIFRMETR